MIASFFCCSMHSSPRSRSSFSSLISEEPLVDALALRQLVSRWCGVLYMSSRSERYEIIDGSPPKE